jgi:hypothetical protein
MGLRVTKEEEIDGLDIHERVPELINQKVINTYQK